MKIAGVVAEYNPFHNGHRFHLIETRMQSGCDAVVAVMSGNFVQRGEPAIFDKWARTRMALACGADAVLELPAFYALQSADWFAAGSVSVLSGIGANVLSFGSELPDVASLIRLADFWDDEPEEINRAVKAGMKSGKSHPRARADALAEFAGDSGAAEALAMPNSVLAAMYLRQMKLLGCAMEPLAIQRIEAGYHEEEISGNIASATAVRRAMLSGAGWQRAVPQEAAAIIMEAMACNAGPVSQANFETLLLYALRVGADIPDKAEGLDNRIRNAANTAGTIADFQAAAKCKRYTMARIKRAAMQAMLGITEDDIALIRKARPAYARLLGYSRRAEGLVGELARRAKIPFITRPPEFKPEEPAMQRLWQIDLAASDVYALGQKNPALRASGRDFTEKLIVI